MGKRTETFKALPITARFLIILVVVTLGFFAWFVLSGGAKRSRAEDACKDAVKTKVGSTATFGEQHTTDAAQGRFDVTGTVTAPNASGVVLQVSYDCLVDGDGTNADVELLDQ